VASGRVRRRSALADAKNRSLTLAIDDVRAQKKAKAFCSSLTYLDTVAIVVSLIQEGTLTVANPNTTLQAIRRPRMRRRRSMPADYTTARRWLAADIAYWPGEFIALVI